MAFRVIAQKTSLVVIYDDAYSFVQCSELFNHEEPRLIREYVLCDRLKARVGCDAHASQGPM